MKFQNCAKCILEIVPVMSQHLTPSPEFNWRLELCQKLKISNLMPKLNYKKLGHRIQEYLSLSEERLNLKKLIMIQ